MPWKCLIVDDDPVMCEMLASFCANAEAIGEADIANSGLDGLKLLEQNRYDLVFLDLNMPQVSGKELLELMPDEVPVVMVTSDAAFAVESYNYNVVGYLVKPVSLAQFLKTVGRLKDVIAEPQYMYVKDGTQQVKIKLASLRYVKSDSNYVTFYVDGQRVMSLMRLSDLEKDLPASFLRVHRSYIINTAFVERASTSKVEVDGTSIPISESYRAVASKRLHLTS